MSIFGTGYVARIFWRALQEKGLSGRVRSFAVSDGKQRSGQQRSFCGRPVRTVAEFCSGAGGPEKTETLCIAVHESILEEVQSTLKVRGLTGVWVYPFLFDLLYGEPVCERTEIPVAEILEKQPGGQYWLAVRYAAVLSFMHGGPEGAELYRKAMSLFSTQDTAQKRLERFGRLINEIRADGFDPQKPVLLDEQFRIIDGLHRIALAAYLGRRTLSCRIYPASPLYEEVLDSRNFLTEEILKRPVFSEEDRSRLREVYGMLHGDGK